LKNILVPVEDHGSLEQVFAMARLAGAQAGARIEGAALGPDTGDLIAADFAIAGSIFDDKTRREIVENARRAFETHMRAHNVPAADETTSGLSYAWAGGEMLNSAAIGAYGRLFDLIVVGRPGSGRSDPRLSTLEAVLFEAGRPLLIAPRKIGAALDGVIVISWNRSTETARTVAFAMPLLQRARRVVVLTVEGATTPGPGGELLARNLQRHGVAVDYKQVDQISKPAGRVILEEAGKLGADLLVKGGYTQSRLRQMIFGGATSEILAHAEMPVFMAH
jgi:nucleotide-binding universal stress UspA family protein